MTKTKKKTQTITFKKNKSKIVFRKVKPKDKLKGFGIERVEIYD